MNQKDVSDAIKELSRQEQLVISLFYEQKLTTSEVSHILEIPNKSVIRICERAINRIFEKANNELPSYKQPSKTGY